MLLRRWFRANGRDLPWRNTRDPYHILVSELMLQQTQVSRVVPKYAEFLAAFPTLHHVARARPARVMEAWSGLGYYARARNLRALARVVTDRGRYAAGTLPPDAESLRALPGVGAYTAGAVSSFAYERRAELVDTNVARVLKRVFAPDVALKTGAGQKRLWAIARAVAAHGEGHVDAQPGDHGAGGVGVHGAHRALRGVSGEETVRHVPDRGWECPVN